MYNLNVILYDTAKPRKQRSKDRSSTCAFYFFVCIQYTFQSITTEFTLRLYTIALATPWQSTLTIHSNLKSMRHTACNGNKDI